MRKNTPTYLVGTDPGVSTFSLAVWHCNKKEFVEFHTGTLSSITQLIWDWIKNKTYNLAHMGFVVEDPNIDTAFYDGWKELETQIKMYKFNQAKLKDIESVYRKHTKMAQNVGQNKMVAAQFIAWLKMQNLEFLRIAPSSRTKVLKKDATGKEYRLKGVHLKIATMPTKTNAGEFQLITGHKGKTNEHQRDAGTLVFDRTLKWFASAQLVSNH